MDRKVADVTEILYEEQGEALVLGIFLSALMTTATGADLFYTDESENIMSIKKLPDNVFLEIFDYCRKDHKFHDIPVWRWHELVHVCQSWRQIIFESPRRLDLQILCTRGTPVRESLDIWPPFPIAIQYHYGRTFTPSDTDNLFAALAHHSRIRQVDLYLTGLQLGEVATVMQQPFPALTHLTLQWFKERPPALPSGFLGGSAPCLQHMHLERILFPALPVLLLSTSDLVELTLGRIPPGGYISPESMAICLAALPRLKTYFIGSCSVTSHTDRMGPPPVTRFSVPALIDFGFDGDSEYLEDLVARIDCPRLNVISIGYLNQLHDLQLTQLFKFIDRSEDPEISLIRHVDIIFSCYSVVFEMYPCPGSSRHWGRVTVSIACQQIERQASLVAQVFSQPSTMLSRALHLKLSPDMDNVHCYYDDWLYLLRQFSIIRTLHVSLEFVWPIASTLKNATGDAVTEVLPVVDLIYLDGQLVSCVENFLAARLLSGRPVTIVDTQAEFDERVKSYVE